MSFVPSSAQLCGLSLQVAELYGKPHIHAHYAGKGVRTHRMDDGATCAVCRRMATNVHHVPPVSKGLFTLRTPRGEWELRPALFALCGSGTTGCHNLFHGGARYQPEWVWFLDYQEAWWSGDLLKTYEPHDPGLFAYGRWVIHDRNTGTTFEPWR